MSEICLSSEKQQTVQILMSCALGKWDNYHEIDAQVGDGEDRWKSTFECFLLSREGRGVKHVFANNLARTLCSITRLKTYAKVLTARI